MWVCTREHSKPWRNKGISTLKHIPEESTPSYFQYYNIIKVHQQPKNKLLEGRKGNEIRTTEKLLEN